jgi:hypothetical protein
MQNRIELSPAPVVEMTYARRSLAEMIEAREAKTSEIVVLNERMARLEAARTEAAKINDELTRMNIVEQGAMLDWANADDGSDAPSPDTARRQELIVALARATSKANAADGATRSLQSQKLATDAILARLMPSIPIAVAMIVVETVEGEIPALAAAAAEIERVKGRIKSGIDLAYSIADAAPDDMGRSIRLAAQGFHEKMRDAPNIEIDHAPAYAAWSSFAAALSASATATATATL